jgi:hypothetical protein
MTRAFPTTTPRALAACLSTLAVLCLVACNATSTPPARNAAASPPPPPPASLAPAVREGETRLGIEVRQWLVEADEVTLASTLAAWAGGGDSDAGGGETDGDGIHLLLEEGVSIAQGPADELVAVLTALGGTRTDLRVWHGQAIEWRDLTGVNLPSSTIAVAEGRPLAIPAGRLSLQMRGWVQAMERGAACEVELAVRWKPERRASIGLELAPTELAAWVGELAVLRSVGRDEALLLTSSGRPSPPEDPGPPVIPPPTLGDLLFKAPAPGLATVLLVWPSLPDWLHPEDDRGDASDPEAAAASDDARDG